MNTALQWLGASAGILGLVGTIISWPKTRGEGRQAEGAGAKSTAEGQVALSQEWRAERDDILRKAGEARRGAEEALTECNERMRTHSQRLRVRDEATYDLLEVLETVITPVLNPAQRATLHEAMSKMRDAMYD